jgi:hypothetical protein
MFVATICQRRGPSLLGGDGPLFFSPLSLVAELTTQGMSTRAIAPIVGATDRTVRNDVAGGKSFPPVFATPAPAAEWSPDTGFKSFVASLINHI